MQTSELIAALEEADGPSRELDAQLHLLRTDDRRHPYLEGAFIPASGKTYSCPTYTTSIDAALTLVPEGYDWEVARMNGGLTIHAKCGSRDMAFGNTPAIALCIAALKARPSHD